MYCSFAYVKNTTIPPHSVEVKIKGEKTGFPVLPV
jgi:hypothetical protein